MKDHTHAASRILPIGLSIVLLLIAMMASAGIGVSAQSSPGGFAPRLTTTPSHTPYPAVTFEAFQNGGFEIDADADKRPDGWNTKHLKRRDGIICNKDGKTVSYEGNCAFRFVNKDGKSRLRQVIKFPEGYTGLNRLILNTQVLRRNFSLRAIMYIRLTVVYASGHSSHAEVRDLLAGGTSEYWLRVVKHLLVEEKIQKIVVEYEIPEQGGLLLDDVQLGGYVGPLMTATPRPTRTPFPGPTVPCGCGGE